ncbi:MAG: class I SAM-dependent methyltransferase, partial [Thermodesulfobacteriota bacterium]
YEQVIGIDIAMRWLHVSRRRFMDIGLPVPPLVCCCAEYLPFPDGMFDLVVASATLEFVHDQQKALSECARCLNDNGSLYINTVNRFSIAQDPYAYLWGVGFLPRAWQARYVRWRRNAIYNIRLLSFQELNQMAAKYFATKEFILPDIDNTSLHQLPRLSRLQGHIYRQLRKLPLFHLLLKWFGPGWDAIFRKHSLT